MPFIQIRNREEIKNIVFKENPIIPVACISYEERCLAFFDVIKELFTGEIKDNNIYTFKIMDDESIYRKEAEKYTEENLKKLRNNHTMRIETIECGLMEEKSGVKELLDRLNSQTDGNYNMFIDLSTLPRRFLLEILMKFVTNKNIRNIMIFYTIPVKYQSPLVMRDLMVQDLLQGKSLGGSKRMLIASLGLNGTQLKVCIEHVEPISGIIPIIPFPSTILQEVLYRNDNHLERWKSQIRKFMYAHPYNPLQLIEILEKEIMGPYIGMKDIAFSLAPLSTKIHSLAMFVYGINNNINIIYAQPKTYGVPYSYGYNKFFIYLISKDSTRGAQIWLKIDSGIWTGKFLK